MSVEVCHYRLALRGKPVGSHLLSTQLRGRTALLEARMTLQGSLGNATVIQRSKVHRQQFFSFSFEEETIASNDRRSFNVNFDIEAGLVQASKGTGDQASMPYVTSYEDPLGLLYHLRQLGPQEQLRAPMLGKSVLVERVGLTKLETVFGDREAQAYSLQPGGSYVYVDQEEPRLILMMSQRLEGQLLEAFLVRVDEEDEPPPVKEERRPRRSSRRRRRRSRN